MSPAVINMEMFKNIKFLFLRLHINVTNQTHHTTEMYNLLVHEQQKEKKIIFIVFFS